MKQQLALLFIFSSLLVTGCNNASDSKKKETEVSSVRPQMTSKKFSPEDQKIIDKYNKEVEDIPQEDEEKFHSRLKKLIPEVNQISDKTEREKKLMSIYLIVGMYNEAYTLNEQQLADKPSDPALLLFKCHLLDLLKKDKNTVTQCYDNAAITFKNELDKPSIKSTPNYQRDKFTYLVMMIKGGHPEYKQKAEDFIANTKDGKMKEWVKSLYETEVGKQ